ncbi:MAG: hypothetical protein KDK36_20705, partial [Leptospiraceae bacterium]|nr:hypothetical protein [Leptospiraceae bacterium]
MISKILDWYFSLPTEYPIFFLACVPAVFSYYMRKALDRQDREIKKSLFIFIFIGGLIWISVLFFTTKRSISAYWGNLKKIEFILFREPNLWVIDTVTDNSSDHPNHIFRLNIIKIETGERVFRSIIGNNFNKIYKTDSKLVLMNIQDEEKLEDCIIYNLSDFNQSLNLNPEYLENSLIPTPGIQSLKFYSENTIKITNKKGYIYYYNIITK